MYGLERSLEIEKSVLKGIEAGLRCTRPLLSGTVAKEDEIIEALQDLSAARKISLERIERFEIEIDRHEKLKAEHAPMRPTFEEAV